MTIEPYCAWELARLREALTEIWRQENLPDEIADQRALCKLADCVAAICGYQDTEAIAEAMSYLVDDGIAAERVTLNVEMAVERAQAALEYRESTPDPKRIRVAAPRPVVEKIARSTQDALDWLIRWHPERLDAFIADRSPEQLDMMIAYIESKKGNPHG